MRDNFYYFDLGFKLGKEDSSDGLSVLDSKLIIEYIKQYLVPPDRMEAFSYGYEEGLGVGGLKFDDYEEVVLSPIRRLKDQLINNKAASKKNDHPSDTRETFFKNYDYGGPEEASETSPGRGLYNGKMDKFKSVKEFIEKKRKKREKLKRKNALEIHLLGLDKIGNE